MCCLARHGIHGKAFEGLLQGLPESLLAGLPDGLLEGLLESLLEGLLEGLQKLSCGTKRSKMIINIFIVAITKLVINTIAIIIVVVVVL